MKIEKINSRNRRDFWADYKCQGCGYIEEDKRGYDDRNFYEFVIPKMKCLGCGESSESLGIKEGIPEPKYPEGYQI